MIIEINKEEIEYLMGHKENIIRQYVYEMYTDNIKKMRYIYYFLRENNKEFDTFAKTHDYYKLTEDERRHENIRKYMFILFLDEKYEELSSIFHLFCKEVKGFKKYATEYLEEHNNNLRTTPYCSERFIYGFKLDEELRGLER